METKRHRSEWEVFLADKNHLPISLNRGQVLFSENETASGCYLILEHHVNITIRESLSSRSTLLWTAGPDQWIGITAFFQDLSRYMYTAQVGSLDCKAIYLNYEDFKSLLEDHHAFKVALTKSLCNRLSFMEMRYAQMQSSDFGLRVLNMLSYFARAQVKLREDAQTYVNLKIDYSIEELALLTGVSPSFFQRSLSQYIQKGWVAIEDGHPVIISPAPLGLVEVDR